MDFRFSKEEMAFRAEVAAYITKHCTEGVVPDDLDGAHYVDTPERRQFMKALAKGGYLGLSWPREYGGKAMPFIYDYHLIEELARAGAPRAGKGVGIIGQTLMRRGSEAQKKKFLPMILNAEIEWAIGYSEPDAGSDLAALKIKVIWPSSGRTTPTFENRKRALGREKRANIRPVISASSIRPIKISKVASACPTAVAGCMSP